MMADLKISHILRLDAADEKMPLLSGAENHIFFLLPALAEAGLDVELIVVLKKAPPIIEKTFERLRKSGVHITTLHLATKAGWRYLGILAIQRTANLTRSLRARKNRIIHLHLDYFGAPVAAGLAGCSKVVLSIHNDEKWFRSLPAGIWLRLIDSLVIKRYIAISKQVMNYYCKVVGVAPKKMKQIYYGVDYQFSDLSSMDLRKKFNIPDDKYVVGFVGRLTYQKNVELLIAAARKLSDIDFVIVGEGELREALQAQAHDLVNVHFLGAQSNGFELMTMFDLFCLPSRYEGLGLVLIEATLQGIPIVASRSGAIPEILEYGKYGTLFDSDDLEGLCKSIQYAIDNKPAISNMANLANQYAKRTFNLQKMVNDTIEFYKSI